MCYDGVVSGNIVRPNRSCVISSWQIPTIPCLAFWLPYYSADSSKALYTKQQAELQSGVTLTCTKSNVRDLDRKIFLS